MKRREFITLLGGAAAAGLAARAQHADQARRVPDIAWDGTDWNHGDVVADWGADPNFWGHRTYWSVSCGTDASPWGVTMGYMYHLPPTWYSQPTRKFPVLYCNHGGGIDENWPLAFNQTNTPLADFWYDPGPTPAVPPFHMNWGDTAPCVIIFANNSRRNYGFDAKPGARMYGRIMTNSAFFELIDECERADHPVFAGRLVPQGNNDPNGARGRGAEGGSGGALSVVTHACFHPERFSSVQCHALIGMHWWIEDQDHLNIIYNLANDDQTWWMAQLAVADVNNPTGPGPGPLFLNNRAAIQAANIAWRVTTSVGEGMDTTAIPFANWLTNNGFSCVLNVLSWTWHTNWDWVERTLPWFVSKCRLWPSLNPASYATTQDTALQIPGSTLVFNDTDPQNLSLSVASVQNPQNGSVSLSGGTVTFTPSLGYTGPASFDYTAQNTDGWQQTATVSLQVNMAAGTGD